jgi:hypothetical protein
MIVLAIFNKCLEKCMILVEMMVISFEDIELSYSDIPKVRGFFANKYKDKVEFHNHIENGFDYRYPQIQFRIINKRPALIGVNRGIKILKEVVFHEDELIVDKEVYRVNEKHIAFKRSEFGKTDELCHYQLITPWMALKEENYKIYMELDKFERPAFLNHLLRENLKSLSKGFDYFIEDIDSIIIDGKFFPITVNFKNQKMLCFRGNFSVNFSIPDYLGIGKQSARGFGTVKRKELI